MHQRACLQRAGSGHFTRVSVHTVAACDHVLVVCRALASVVLGGGATCYMPPHHGLYALTLAQDCGVLAC